jgi:hypothetical protein
MLKTNEDFRKLLDTASLQQRPATSSAPPTESKAAGDGGEGEKKKRKFHKQKPKPEKPVSVYRDRAAERRQDKGEEGEQNDAAPAVTAEESKFLGGDVQYTHLVRGLDVALMEKVRAEQLALAAKKEILETFGSEGSENDDHPQNDDDNAVDSLGKRVSALLQGDKIVVKTATTARVSASLFAPGRMAYLFDLDNPLVEKPTINMRAVAVSGHNSADRRSMAAVPLPVIDDVANALAYGAGKKHKKRPVAVAATAEAKEPEGVITLADVSRKRAKDEEKIFSDASSDSGEEQQQEKKVKLDVQKGSYFAAAGVSQPAQTYDPLRSVLGVSAVKVEAAAKALALKKQAEKKRLDEQLERSKAAAERASAASGAYGSYLQRTVTVPVEKEVDEEEEAKKTRYIVEEDDEVDDQAILSSYRAALEEILPADDGKKRATKKPKKKNSKMKANQEFEKIEKIVAEKKAEKE